MKRAPMPKGTRIETQPHDSGHRATVYRDGRKLYVTITKPTPEQARAEARKFTDLLAPQPRRQGRRFWESTITRRERNRTRTANYAKKCGPVEQIDPAEYNNSAPKPK